MTAGPLLGISASGRRRRPIDARALESMKPDAIPSRPGDLISEFDQMT